MVTRYNLPANQPLINTYTPLPFNELLLAGQSMQKQKDDLEIQRLDLAGKDVFHLPQDEQGAKSAQDWLNSESEKIAGLYGTNLRSAKQAMQNFKLEAAKRFGEFGDIGAYNKSVSNYQSYVQDLDEKVKNKTLDPHTRDLLISEAMSNYKGIGEYNPTKGYNTFSGNTAAIHQDLPKWIKDNLSDLEAITNATASAGPDGKGYIFTDKSTGEVVSPERVKAAFTQLANSDESLMNWVSEGDRLGVDRLAMLNSAGSAGVTKYAYYKNTRDKSASTDGTWKYGQEQKALEEFNTPIQLPSNQEVINDELTKAATDFTVDINGNKIPVTPGINTFNRAEVSLNRERDELQYKISQLEKFGGTVEYQGSTESDINVLKNRMNEINQEIDKNNSIKSSILKQSYNISDQELNQMGFGSIREYDNAVSNFQSKAEDIIKSQEFIKSRNTSKEKLVNNSKDKNYSIYFDPTTGKASATLNATSSRDFYTSIPSNVSEDIRAYNLSLDMPQMISENFKEDKIFNKFRGDKTWTTADSGVNMILDANAKLKNSQKSADNQANYYVNNRTVTSPMVMYSPEAVKNSNLFSTMNSLMQTDAFSYSYTDDQGNKQSYDPFKTVQDKSNPLLVSKERKDLNFVGYKIDQRDGGLIFLAKEGDTDGKIVEAKLSSGLDGSNITSKLHEKAITEYQQAYQTALQTGNTSDLGDAMIRVAATSSGDLNNIYKNILKEFNDLAEGVNSGSPNDLILSKGIKTSTGDNLYISKDAQPDLDGKQYNVYSPGITKEQIESGSILNNATEINGEYIIMQGGQPIVVMRRLSYEEVIPSVLQESGYF